MTILTHRTHTFILNAEFVQIWRYCGSYVDHAQPFLVEHGTLCLIRRLKLFYYDSLVSSASVSFFCENQNEESKRAMAQGGTNSTHLFRWLQLLLLRYYALIQLPHLLCREHLTFGICPDHYMRTRNNKAVYNRAAVLLRTCSCRSRSIRPPT